MGDKIDFDARNHNDNISDRKIPQIPYIDTAGLQQSLEALRVTFNLPAPPPDRVVMECWEEYRHQAKREFLQGFDDGYFGRGPDKPKMSEPYSQGYSDGYALAQMQDAQSGQEEGYDDDYL